MDFCVLSGLVTEGRAMEQTDLRQFQRTLEEMLAELKDPLHRREDISIENSPDALDDVQNARDREMAIRRLENDSSRLHNLADALQRIQDRTYGFCLRCDTSIDVKRLNAVPWASHCLHCQSIVDRNSSQEPEPTVGLHARNSGLQRTVELPSEDGEAPVIRVRKYHGSS